MPKQSEALILRTYPFHEADLLVTFFTRSEGKVRGVAKAAKKSKRRFGGALEPLTHVIAHWEDKEKQELARLDSCDIISSPLTTEVSYPRVVALSYVAEVIDQLLPDRETNDDIFRLALAVVKQIKPDSIWMPLTYFDLWIVRLIGLLPELTECVVCGESLNGDRAWFHPLADGLLCVRDKRLASIEIAAESRNLASEMFRAPIEKFAGNPWPRQIGADLRRFLAQRIERHIERKLVTAAMLEKLD
ncbi:MAG TPA: DNA repair protein RecO [Candidatus Angelobacter sp.]|jgi:DNA repair protein RecO (recombination protein O)|nr:DNA repair protein RecO [Candidatus Angelobacter sp.]